MEACKLARPFKRVIAPLQMRHELKQRVQAPKTFRDFFLTSLAKYAGRPFISAPLGSGRETVTFKEVHERAERLAGWMLDQSLGQGSRIAIGGSNSVG